MKRIFWIIATVLSVVIVLYSLRYYPHQHPRLNDWQALHFLRYRPLLLGHITGATLALIVGPWQFATPLRRLIPRYHRLCGYVYFIAVLMGGLFAFALSAVSMGGLLAHLGFGLLALLWMGTTIRAVELARDGNLADHRLWMIRSFSLTFAAVTLRIWLPLLLVRGVRFEIAYPLAAWLCWVPNLLLAELYLRASAAPRDARYFAFGADR